MLLRDCRIRDSQIGMIGGLGMPTTHRARIKYHQYQLRSSISASLRFFPLILALLRVFLDRFASSNLASMSFPCERLIIVRSAPRKSAPNRFALETSATYRFACAILVLDMLVPLRLHLVRSACSKLVPSRSAPERSLPCR